MKHKWLIPLIFITVIVLWVAHIFLQTGDFCLIQWAQSQQSGHVSEALSALFSGLAFAGLIVAVFLQKEDLKQTREELRGQREQMELQNRMLKHQQFETTFFQLLKLHNEIVNSMDVVVGPRTLSGRDCFRRMYQVLGNAYNQTKKRASEQPEAERIKDSYWEFYQHNQADAGNYFRTLYNIVKFVDRSDVDDKKFYTNLVRAQLSTFELLLLFYNCMSSLGREKFKPLVAKYELLKHMDPKLVLDDSHLTEVASFFPQ